MSVIFTDEVRNLKIYDEIRYCSTFISIYLYYIYIYINVFTIFTLLFIKTNFKYKLKIFYLLFISHELIPVLHNLWKFNIIGARHSMLKSSVSSPYYFCNYPVYVEE